MQSPNCVLSKLSVSDTCELLVSTRMHLKHSFRLWIWVQNVYGLRFKEVVLRSLYWCTIPVFMDYTVEALAKMRFEKTGGKISSKKNNRSLDVCWRPVYSPHVCFTDCKRLSTDIAWKHSIMMDPFLNSYGWFKYFRFLGHSSLPISIGNLWAKSCDNLCQLNIPGQRELFLMYSPFNDRLYDHFDQDYCLDKLGRAKSFRGLGILNLAGRDPKLFKDVQTLSQMLHSHYCISVNASTVYFSSRVLLCAH